MDVNEFDKLLAKDKTAVERFVKFKISIKEDAEDILQNTYITAMQKCNQLNNKDSFKAWIISIARNKCNDYFRNKAKFLDIPVENLIDKVTVVGKNGITEINAIHETIEKLGSKEKQILYLYYWKEMSQEEIAKKLEIPIGTVKSRLFNAKQKFKEKY